MRKLLLILLILGSISLPRAADSAATLPLFASDDVLAVTLTGPLRSLVRADDVDDKSEFDFTLTTGGRDVAVKLRQRGNFRREQCNVPPIRLNFRKSETEGPFAGQDKLKLVNPCGKGDTDEQNLLDEYALYRIASLIMPQASFRTRLLQVNWQDTEGRTRWGTRYAFVIEDVDALTARLGGEHIEPERLEKASLADQHQVRVSLFNYLAGNTDFSQISGPPGSPCCHNGKAIRVNGTDGSADEQVLVVPYDFDMAGSVGARYALPSEKLPIRSVRQRLYRGFCVTPEVLAAVIDELRGLREPILAVFRNTPGFSERSVRAQLKYAQSFFAELDRSDAPQRFERSCR